MVVIRIFKATTIIMALLAGAWMLQNFANLLVSKYPQYMISEIFGIEFSDPKYFGQSPVANDELNDELNEELQHSIDIRSDHDAVSSWIRSCVLSNDDSKIISSDRQIELMFSSMRNREFMSFDTFPNDQEIARDFYKIERMAINLSKSIGMDRENEKYRSLKSYRRWEYFTITSIAIGMLTTILVSMSSTDFGRGDGVRQSLIRFFAIAFPAVGTAVTATIAFYGPQAEWSLSTRTLASLSQIHAQMASDIWKYSCEPDDKNTDSDLKRALEAWAKNYNDVITVSAAGGSAGAASNSSQVTQGQQTGQEKQNPDQKKQGSDSASGQQAKPEEGREGVSPASQK